MQKITVFIKYISSLFLGIMVLLVVVNTILRYIFSTSIIQTEELCRYLFMWIVYLSAVVVWNEKGHICVTIVTDHLSGAASRIMQILVCILSLFALGMLFYGSVLYYDETTLIGQVTYIPYRVMILPVGIAAVACLLLTLRDLFNLLGRKDLKHKDRSTEAL
ncbi:MAG: TRAP transporter small permease [Succinivibrio sp.]|nr:TRAP transporter small permease [Succinivibrio sp.]